MRVHSNVCHVMTYQTNLYWFTSIWKTISWVSSREGFQCEPESRFLKAACWVLLSCMTDRSSISVLFPFDSAVSPKTRIIGANWLYLDIKPDNIMVNCHDSDCQETVVEQAQIIDLENAAYLPHGRRIKCHQQWRSYHQAQPMIASHKVSEMLLDGKPGSLGHGDELCLPRMLVGSHHDPRK